MTTPSIGSKFRGVTGAFRAVAYLEAITFLVLLAGVVVHRVLEGSDTIVNVMGPVHGIVFLVYLVLVLRIRAGQGWGFWYTILIIVLAAVPFGGFWAGNHLTEEQSPSAA